MNKHSSHTLFTNINLFLLVGLIFSVTGCQAMNQVDTEDSKVLNIPLIDSMKTLTQHDWALESVVDQMNKPVMDYSSVPSPADLNFYQAGGTISYGFNIGCNTFGAEISIDNNVVTPDILRSTRMYCANLDGLEKSFAGLMGGKSKFSLYPSNPIKLEQITEDGSKLIWIGKKR